MISLALCVALSTILLGGAGVHLLLLGDRVRLNIVELLCFAWLFGTGSLSILLWAGGFFFHGAVLQVVVTTSLVALGLSGWKKARRGLVVFYFPELNNTTRLLGLILAVEMMLIVLYSLGSPLQLDGSLNWEIKARFAFLNDGVMPAGYFGQPTQADSHPEYPLFIPMVQLWLYLWLGAAHQVWAKLIFPIYGATGAALLALYGARLSHQRWAGLLAAALAFLVPRLAGAWGGVTGGYPDFALAVLYLACISNLIFYLKTNRDDYFRIYAAGLALLPWLKRDGVILWAVALLCGIAVVKPGRKWLGFLPGPVILVLWQLYLRSVGATPPHDFIPVTFATFISHLDRAQFIWHALVTNLLDLRQWSIFWFLVAVAFAYQTWRARDKSLLVSFSALVLPIVLYSSTYLFSSWPDYRAHIHSSLSRLLIHVALLGWLVVAWASKGLAPQPRQSKAPSRPAISFAEATYWKSNC